jgi:hypothetical protein
MFYRIILTVPLLLASAAAENIGADATHPDIQRTWTVGLQGGVASTFQMTLGGVFGEGPAVQDKLTAGLNNAFREGDSLTAFGWSTTDMRSHVPSWQTGLNYRNRLFRSRHQSLAVGAGIQRWLLPSVKTGANDWVLSGSLNYTTKIRRVPLFVSGDSCSLLASTLPTGSTVYTQIYTEHPLLRRESLKVLLRHGPQYTYSWGFYGAEGNRVVRYTGLVAMTWKDTTIEAGYRQQFGLQDRIRNYGYWSVLVSRQMNGLFHSTPKLGAGGA